MVMDNLIMLCRLDTASDWDQVSNPGKSDLAIAKAVLSNAFNNYVEWSNCGVVYRVIRAGDLESYTQESTVGQR